jgi:hypothetical protein
VRQATRNIAVANIVTEVGHLYARERGHDTPGPSGDWRSALGSEGPIFVYEVVWDLIVQRVLTFVTDNGLALTAFGREVVREQSWSPYDPDGYLRELKSQASRLFDVCQLYVAEALSCFRGGSYIAASVMLGAASEAAMLDLFQQLATAMRAGKMPEVDDYERKLSKEFSFYKRYELFMRHFGGVRPKLPGALTDDLDGQMVGVFHLIRQYRNEAGHPTGTAVERMAAFRNLTLFAYFCKRIEEIGNWLLANPEKLT